MAISLLSMLGLATATFVGVNVGGSSTGVALGPATGSGTLSMRRASMLMAVFVVLGGLAIGAGAFFLGPRTMETVGNEITYLPVEAALVVELVSATIVTGPSWNSIRRVWPSPRRCASSDSDGVARVVGCRSNRRFVPTRGRTRKVTAGRKTGYISTTRGSRNASSWRGSQRLVGVAVFVVFSVVPGIF
jgi:Phosphate transporter family